MKTRYTYALVFLAIHILLSVIALNSFDPNIPNSDLGMIAFPNIFIPLLLTGWIPNIFNISTLYWCGIFWVIVGFLIGLIVEKLRVRRQKI